MRDEFRELRAAFAGTPLAGLPIGHGPAGTLLVAGVDLTALAANLELSRWELAVARPAATPGSCATAPDAWRFRHFDARISDVGCKLQGSE
ncbi:hypothetical protein [Dactylosporangium sp. NPDC051541]|uniref:hypothetical protein n=1 Tax=Dactylosporangium sp. NPDC051541 TaxID=3363977 RepID=UPI0037A3B289